MYMYTWYLEAREGVKVPETVITASCKPPCRFWKPNPDPLQEQPVLLTEHLMAFFAFYFCPRTGVNSSEQNLD